MLTPIVKESTFRNRCAPQKSAFPAGCHAQHSNQNVLRRTQSFLMNASRLHQAAVIMLGGLEVLPAFCVALVPRACSARPKICATIPAGAKPSPPLSLSDRLSSLKFGYEADGCESKDDSIRYKCRNGHLVTVQRGTPACARCPACIFSECGRGSGRLCIRKLQLTAHERGGELLSTVYIGARERLLWRCGRGHVWAATSDNVRRRGSWCPRCALSASIE
eukprot:IDg16513t1